MQTKMVVFDMTGTTVEDSDHVHQSMIKAMGGKGFKINHEDANKVMGYAKSEAIERLLREKFGMREGMELKAASDAIYQSFHLDMVHHYRYSPDLQAKANVEYVFDSLRKKGIKVVIGTGFSREIADAIIDRLMWKKNRMIDYSVASDEVKNGRPHADMIEKAMAEFNISDPAAVTKVGDTPVDLMEGVNGRCGHVIGVTGGAYKREELEMEKYTNLVDDLVDILTIIK